MSDVRAILVVPAEAWRERLLGFGALGAGVPVVAWMPILESDPAVPLRLLETGRGEWVEYDASDAWQRAYGARLPLALALAFDGESTGPEGLARALACLAEAGRRPGAGWVRKLILGGASLEDLKRFAHTLVGAGIAERVEVLHG
jgi:hypothetical protein